MKTIGLIGGMSWESTADYYRIINQEVSARLGGHHSAELILYSVEFAPIVDMQHENRWPEAAESLTAAGRSLAAAGADFALLCTNTMHKVFDQIQGGLSIPLLHIVDTTAAKIKEKGLKTIGLLGTKFTMEDDFYRDRLFKRHGLSSIIPPEDDRSDLHRILYKEICAGTVSPESRELLKAMIERLGARGAEGIILGCTEIPLLIKQKDSPLPLFDTTALHSIAAVEFALKD